MGVVAGEDRRILFTYDRFAGVESLPQPGPVYVHAEACERYSEHAGFPEELRGGPRTVEAYAHGRRLVAQEYVGGWGIRAGHRKTARPSQRRLSTGQQHHRWLFHLPH